MNTIIINNKQSNKELFISLISNVELVIPTEEILIEYVQDIKNLYKKCKKDIEKVELFFAYKASGK